MKQALGLIAAALTFGGYVPYIRDTLARRTTPHVFTWFITGLVTSIAFALQITHNGGPGALATLAAAVICFVIFGVSYRVGNRNITAGDSFFFATALLALVIWLFARQPVVAVIIVSVADILGFAPTIRKSWNKPYEETLVSYQLNTLRFVITVLALNQISIITALYPLSRVFANGLFSMLLIVRRVQLKRA